MTSMLSGRRPSEESEFEVAYGVTGLTGDMRERPLVENARPVPENLRQLPSVHDTETVGPIRHIRVGAVTYDVQRHLDAERTPVRYVRIPGGPVWMVNRHMDVFRVVEKDPEAKRRVGIMLHAQEDDEPFALVEAARMDGMVFAEA